MKIDTISSRLDIKWLSDAGSAVKVSSDVTRAFREPIDLPPVGKVRADNDPSKLYATIQKDGNVIATFYTSGLMVTPNNVSLPQNFVVDGSGLSLADSRIRQILDLHGGEVQYTHAQQARRNTMNAATLFAAHLAGQ
ncbi:hypothetical protein [Methylobacterium sp. 77]|uniref:hypothetical protein n=1 Tax=Methylobacterium sp. 77 TaxID=1101192 RepID=UPI000376145E|nr:hypothetical protein [Methylobacterium sp. 77]